MKKRILSRLLSLVLAAVFALSMITMAAPVVVAEDGLLNPPSDAGDCMECENEGCVECEEPEVGNLPTNDGDSPIISNTGIIAASDDRPIRAEGGAGPNVSWVLYEDGEW